MWIKDRPIEIKIYTPYISHNLRIGDVVYDMRVYFKVIRILFFDIVILKKIEIPEMIMEDGEILANMILKSKYTGPYAEDKAIDDGHEYLRLIEIYAKINDMFKQ